MTADALVPLVAALLIGGAGLRMLLVRPSPSAPSRLGAMRTWRAGHSGDLHAAQMARSARPSRKPATRSGAPPAMAGATAMEALARYHHPIAAWPGEPMALQELASGAEPPTPATPRGQERRPDRGERWHERVRPRPRPRLRIGLAVVLCIASLAMAQHIDRTSGWVALVPVGVVGLPVARRRLRERRTARARLAAQVEAAPAAVDLLAACLTAGLNGHLALIRVAERCPAALRQEFAQVAADLRVGQSPAVALRAAAERTGLAELRAAAGALHAGERWGAPPAEALAARSEALRARLRLEAEAAAERAAVRLTFPLVLCFLPAFAALTVVPMLAGAVRALGF